MENAILYEDDAYLVFNKPAGITVNRSDTTKGEETVQDWAERYLQLQTVRAPQEIKEIEDVDITTGEFLYDPVKLFYDRGGIVHRLDKETSGILLIAKNPVSFENLQKQFKERVVKKKYKALAHGKVIPEVGEINIPVGRLPWNRRQFGIVAGGRESITLYKVLQYFQTKAKPKEMLSLLELTPLTGRTHQIRVHLQYLRHPIFADFLYAGRKTARNDRKLLDRVFLHAAKISFTHPDTKLQVSYESPFPENLQQILDNYLEKVL